MKVTYTQQKWGEDIATLPKKEHWSWRQSSNRRMKAVGRAVDRSMRKALERLALDSL